MRDQILAALDTISTEEDVRILLAVESGSRAWGFASPDSDWDVRFVYVRPLERYVSIDRPRDVIERNLPGDLDLAGWDLPKALWLFSKSNPALMEWIRSPIVYRQDERFVKAIRALESIYMQPKSGLYHYRSMALTNSRAYLQGETVKLKKYLYCLRPIMAYLYLERTGDWPPVLFQELVDHEVKEPDLRAAIAGLVEAKSKSGELGVGDRIEPIDLFIREQIERMEHVKLPSSPSENLEPLNALFRSELGL